MNIIACDPGIDGGWAVLSGNGMALHVMPAAQAGKKWVLDEQRLVELLRHYSIGEPHVFIEAVGARPGQGVTSMFSFGTGWGIVRGICAGLGLPYELVRPQEWQGEMLKGQPKGSEYVVASRLWPGTDWRATECCTTPHSGLVDAALIAEYGRRRCNGN